MRADIIEKEDWVTKILIKTFYIIMKYIK